MSFYSWDRKFFLVDRESGIYATSAYYFAHMTAGERCPGCFVVATLCFFSSSQAFMRWPSQDQMRSALVTCQWQPALQEYCVRMRTAPASTTSFLRCLALHGGTPLMVLKTLCGALAAYGLAGLRYTTKRQA